MNDIPSGFIEERIDLLEGVRKRDRWYLATPYTNYAAGHLAAYNDALRALIDVTRAGYVAFSPIVHGHPMSAVSKDIPATDGEFWKQINLVHMRMSDGMICVQMPGWKESAGVIFEGKWFREQGKPIAMISHRDATVEYGEARAREIVTAINAACKKVYR